MIGSTLGYYEIISAIGKGGMGEVWRARDTKLGRQVAIKVLPEEFARDLKPKDVCKSAFGSIPVPGGSPIDKRLSSQPLLKVKMGSCPARGFGSSESW